MSRPSQPAASRRSAMAGAGLMVAVGDLHTAESFSDSLAWLRHSPRLAGPPTHRTIPERVAPGSTHARFRWACVSQQLAIGTRRRPILVGRTEAAARADLSSAVDDFRGARRGQRKLNEVARDAVRSELHG